MPSTLYERRGRAAWITLNAPQNRNALSADMIAELGAHLRAAVEDAAVRAIVLTGAGPVFCAGADLKGGGAAVAPGGGQRNPFVEILRLIWEGPKPVIAAVNGHAYVGLMAAADIAIAVETAKFAFSEVRVGVIPAMISVVVLPKLGIHNGMRLFLTGETFTAGRALGYNLLHRVVSEADLVSEVENEIEAISLGGPQAVRAAKQLVRSVPRLSLDEGFAYTEQLIAQLFASDEAAEGMAAFAGKRRPKWAE